MTTGRWRGAAASGGGRRDGNEAAHAAERSESEAHHATEDESTQLLDADDAFGQRKDTWDGFEDFKGMPWWRTPSVYWLVGPYFLYTLAFGGILVPKLNLIVDLVCRKYFADQALIDPNFTFTPVLLGGENPQCQIPEVQKSVAKFTLLLNLVTGVLSAFIAPKLGQLSDRFGRKKFMGISSCGGVVAEIITILCAKYPNTIHYRWMIVGATFDGLTGSFTAGSVLTHSYASDCTPPSRRGVAIGYLHACLFSGLAFGPLIAAQLVSETGNLLLIFYVTLGCHIFFVLFILLALPESLSKRRQKAAREHYANETGQHPRHMRSRLGALLTRNPLAPLKILYPRGPGASPRLRRNLLALSLIDMVLLGGAMGGATVIILYGGLMFGWGTVEGSRYVSLVSLIRAFTLLGIFPVINYYFRTKPAQRRLRETGVAVVETNAGADKLDVWLIRTALVSDVIGVMGYIVARSSPVFVMSGVVTAFGGLGSATIQAALSKHVPAEMVGQLLGAIGLLHALARVFSPIMFNTLYVGTIESFPQAIFVLLASMFAISLAASLFVKPHVFLREEDGQPRFTSSPALSQSDDTAVEDELLI